MSSNTDVAPGGWAVFAAVVLLIIGFLNIFFGIAAIDNPNLVTVSGTDVIVADFDTWGWVHIVIGALMLFSCVGLFAAQNWARVLAIIFATINAIAQIGFFTAFPLWAIIVIILDVLVIYHLVVRPWKPVS